ncbi:MAG: PilZ domain-containing protein [Armatimonadetes bacterium]|nr:PilZ domain-containing protein [Armatimonadota bacterium]
MERTSDGKKFAGMVTLVQSPLVRVRLDEVSNIQVDDKIDCSIGDGVSFATLNATVMSLEDNIAEFWVTIQSLEEGIDRAPRALAPGYTAQVTLESGEEVSASLCDASESGMRLSSLKNVTAGQHITVRVDYPGGCIHSKGKIVWAKQMVDSAYVEMGMQILEMDRLNQARWNHMVSTLMRDFGMAA